MSSIFLCHSSVDKPFVEKLANDLRKAGANVWFDKWEIKVGESILWRIEEGIRAQEYLAIILSPDAIVSDWVKTELGAVWSRQMNERRILVLPILYRDCDIPYILRDRKYADFRSNYEKGFLEICSAIGIEQEKTISEKNWRLFAGKRSTAWRELREQEFKKLVTVLVNRAIEYKWSAWVGSSKTPYSITLHAWISREVNQAVSIKMIGRSYEYMASLIDAYNPNHLKVTDFDIPLGTSINSCEEFVWRQMEDFQKEYGEPTKKPFYHTTRYLNQNQQLQIAQNVLKAVDWYQGDSKLT